MPDPKDPFVIKEIPCPACGAKYPQRFFKIRSFIPKTKESDQHVTEYSWMQSDLRQVHPPYYFLFFCPKCYFADASEDFSKPQTVDNSRWILDSFKRAGGPDNPVIRFLGDRISYDEITFESSLAMHMLSTYEQLLSSKDMLNNYKVARLFLRIAWLYREQAPTAVPRPDSEKAAAILPPAITPEKFKQDVLTAAAECESAIRRAREAYVELGRALDIYNKERSSDSAAPGYMRFFEAMEPPYDNLSADLFQLKSSVDDDTPTPGGTVSPSVEYKVGANGFLGFSSHHEFIKRLKGIWSSTPVDEIEAMRTSIPFFEKAVSLDPRFDSAQAYFSIASLIIDLRVRCNDIDPAFAMVRGMYKAGTDARQKCMQELQTKGLDDTAKQRIANNMRRIGEMIQQAAELRRQLLDHLAARDWPIIERIVQENPRADATSLEKILEDNGISPGLIGHLKETGKLTQLAGKKKGLFS
jgi:hypothetical protein